MLHTELQTKQYSLIPKPCFHHSIFYGLQLLNVHMEKQEMEVEWNQTQNWKWKLETEMEMKKLHQSFHESCVLTHYCAL